MAEEKEDTREEVEDEINHGNTRLPFGLCKRYGVALPDNATPRDAWNALKGKYGITPQDVYNELKQEAKQGKSKEKDSKGRNAQLENIGNIIENKFRSFNNEYREKLKVAINKLDDNELTALRKTIDKVNFAQGRGLFYPLSKTIVVPMTAPTRLDTDLGYDFQATTFFHEYGHYLAKELGKVYNEIDFNNSSEMQSIFAEDAERFFSQAIKNAGLRGDIKVGRLTAEQKDAIYNYVETITDKKTASEHKPIEPYKSNETLQSLTGRYLSWGYSREEAEIRAKERLVEIEKNYNDALKKYHIDLIKWSSIKDKVEKAKVTNLRNSYISDFVAGATSGRVNPYNKGEYGHTNAYWKIHKNGVETWAEYVSFKMTKDNVGLESMKTHLPKTYEKYEQIYKKMGEVLK